MKRGRSWLVPQGLESYLGGGGLTNVMGISSRSHYGLRAMTELAKADGRRPLSLAEIAAVEHLLLPYLEQLVAPLRR